MTWFKKIARAVTICTVFASLLLAGILAASAPEAHCAVYEHEKKTQGQLGKGIVNPYKVAPLTAIIERDGLDHKNITVTVLGKPDGGIDIAYPLSEGALLNYDQFPIFGLYDNYVNNVRGEYTLDGKKVSEVYKIRTNPFTRRNTEGKYEVKPKVESAKTVKGFEDLSVFDNGDGRGLEQPALAQNKRSRAVKYKIDERRKWPSSRPRNSAKSAAGTGRVRLHPMVSGAPRDRLTGWSVERRYC